MTKRTKRIIRAQKNIFLQATARHILKGRSDSKINQIICKTLHERYPIKFATRALLVETKCEPLAKRSRAAALERAFYLKRNTRCWKVWNGHSHQLPRDKFEFGFKFLLPFFALEEFFKKGRKWDYQIGIDWWQAADSIIPLLTPLIDQNWPTSFLRHFVSLFKFSKKW